MKARLLAFAPVVAVLLPATAHAGRPLATEDADVMAAGNCEWESGTGRLTEGGGPTASTASTQLGCGIGWRSQLALGWARVSSNAQGIDALTLTGKTALVPLEPGATGFTLAWALIALARTGEAYTHDASAVNLVATRELADGLTGYANLGWLRNQVQGRSSTTWNVAAAYALNASLEATAEVYGTDRMRPIGGLGLRWSVNDSLTLDTAFSVQADALRSKFFTLGFTLAF